MEAEAELRSPPNVLVTLESSNNESLMVAEGVDKCGVWQSVKAL